MKSIKQIEHDPRVYEVERVAAYDPVEAANWPDCHTPKYFLHLADGYVFDDDYTSVNGADTVRELNDLLKIVIPDPGVR